MMSSEKEIEYGVPQGAVLGLFNIYINGLFYMITKDTIIEVADDTAMFYKDGD